VRRNKLTKGNREDPVKPTKFSIWKWCRAAKDKIVTVSAPGGLLQMSFRHYSKRAAEEDQPAKYVDLSREQIAEDLITTTCDSTDRAGTIATAVVAILEEILIAVGVAGGMAAAAGAAMGFTALGGKRVFTKMSQLHLVARLGVLYGVPLRPDDPKDILTLRGFMSGGAIRESEGAERPSQSVLPKHIAKEVREALRQAARKLGLTISKRTIANASVPSWSAIEGVWWNKKPTRTIGEEALKYFKDRAAASTTHMWLTIFKWACGSIVFICLMVWLIKHW
jgi:hypothetical protein